TLYVVVENVFRGSHYSILLCWFWWLASASGVRCAVSFVAIAAAPVKADCCSPSSPPGEDSGCLWSAQRWRSPAAGSGSEARADAGGSQVQCLVRCSAGMELSPLTRFPSLFLLAGATA